MVWFPVKKLCELDVFIMAGIMALKTGLGLATARLGV